jgi:hypothetical protein
MAMESDRIPDRVACLNTRALPATLISTRGFNCEVWQSAGVIVTAGGRFPVDFVVKRHRFACTLPKLKVLNREYRTLRDTLEEMVPAAVFVATRIEGEQNVVVLAQTCTPWFDLARPGNADEAQPLLARLPKARAQLARFVRAARRWADEGRVLDLYGRENLVLDRDRNVRYLDSFGVFFYESLLYLLAEVDESLKAKIDLSLERLAYLEYLLEAAENGSG